MVVRREELGLIVDDLAERADLSTATIRHVEGAGYDPSFRTLVKMSKALGLIRTVKEWPS